MFRLPHIATALALSGTLALLSLPAAASDLPSQPVLTLAAAQQILTAAQTKAHPIQAGSGSRSEGGFRTSIQRFADEARIQNSCPVSLLDASL